MMSKIWTTITNQWYYETIKEDSTEGLTDWTINKNAKIGDTVLLYVCAPISAIVATAIISNEPYQDDDVNSIWFRGWFAEMENLQMLQNPITRKRLLELFPSWRYWTQPRNSVIVPTILMSRVKEILF